MRNPTPHATCITTNARPVDSAAERRCEAWIAADAVTPAYDANPTANGQIEVVSRDPSKPMANRSMSEGAASCLSFRELGWIFRVARRQRP